MKTITVNNQRYEYERDADGCPICHHAIEPQIINSSVVQIEREFPVLQIVYRCPRHACQRVFIGNFRQDSGRHGFSADGAFKMRSTEPLRPPSESKPEEIFKLSPSYCEIYAQCKAAEAHQLCEVAGVGYRKALEYLIKDYAISLDPKNEEKIKETFLMTCIENYVADPNVKECARRATWLGNDETHYIRKWVNRDLNDLKRLINLTEAWINSDLLTKRYLAEMNKG